MVGNHTVESILKAMQNTLNAHQLKRLKGVLSANLAVETNTVEDNENKNLLNSFLTAKELEGCSERTLKYYESTLAHYIRETSAPLTQVDTEQLRAYLTDYQDTHVVGKVTIDNIRRILATFFSWLEDEDYIVKSPARKIRRVKAPVRVKEIISDEDMERLRDGCETIRDLAMIDLLSSTGMRVGELVKLNRTSINMGERECIVQERETRNEKRILMLALNFTSKSTCGSATTTIQLYSSAFAATMHESPSVLWKIVCVRLAKSCNCLASTRTSSVVLWPPMPLIVVCQLSRFKSFLGTLR